MWEIYTTTLIREAKQCYYIKLNNKLSDPNLGSKKWWSYIKSSLNKNYFRSIPSLIEGDHVIRDALQRANLFNQYFVNQAKINDTDHPLPFLRQNSNFYGATLTIIQTTEQEASDLLSKVDISKACGHNGIGNKILKLCRPGISKTLTKLINLSLQLGEFPTEWKKANVIPIYKKENRQL